MKAILRKSVLIIAFLVLCTQSYAQNTGASILPGMTIAGAFSILERSDWRRYDNGKYVGLVRNEVRASIFPQSGSGESTLYQGNFFVLQSTLRDMRRSAQAVDAIIPVSFEIKSGGSIEIEDDRGFPMMRGFPFYPDQPVMRGEKWRAPGNRAVDPLNLGQAIVIPFTAEYEYRGIENYNGTPVHRIYASYGYNYLNEIEEHPYVRVMGSHKVDILIRAADGLPVFTRDDLNVTYTAAGGSKTEFRGFTLTFRSDIAPLDKGGVIESLENTLVTETPGIINMEDLPDSVMELRPVPEGIKLTIKDIRFAADSPEFLPEEKPRLDLIAQALKKINDRVFLVEGHTASTGRPANEMQLSVERAKSIINELVQRGISAERFIYKGWGGTKPLGDNGTDTGRSANRRVEITILEW